MSIFNVIYIAYKHREPNGFDIRGFSIVDLMFWDQKGSENFIAKISLPELPAEVQGQKLIQIVGSLANLLQ